jgi:hypothetical protein
VELAPATQHLGSAMNPVFVRSGRPLIHHPGVLWDMFYAGRLCVLSVTVIMQNHIDKLEKHSRRTLHRDCRKRYWETSVSSTPKSSPGSGLFQSFVRQTGQVFAFPSSDLSHSRRQGFPSMCPHCGIRVAKWSGWVYSSVQMAHASRSSSRESRSSKVTGNGGVMFEAQWKMGLQWNEPQRSQYASCLHIRAISGAKVELRLSRALLRRREERREHCSDNISSAERPVRGRLCLYLSGL